jgi:TusA-related sulfurtransferase
VPRGTGSLGRQSARDLHPVAQCSVMLDAGQGAPRGRRQECSSAQRGSRTMSDATKVIDARGLMPPEPMELTLAALDDLPQGGEIVLLLYREPDPLYRILRNNGYTHRTEAHDDGTFAIHIRHKVQGS